MKVASKTTLKRQMSPAMIETHSETKSSKVPDGKVEKSAIVETDSENSKSSSDSNSRETMPLVPMLKKEGEKEKEAKPSAAHSSSLPFLDLKLLEEQHKIEWCKYARSLDVNFGNWQDK